MTRRHTSPALAGGVLLADTALVSLASGEDGPHSNSQPRYSNASL
jgi:hypothetical protein